MFMIPIAESFLFVEPIYLQAENSRLPELKRVVVANGNDIAMEPTFAGGARRGARAARLDVAGGALRCSRPRPGATRDTRAGHANADSDGDREPRLLGTSRA